MFLSTADPEYDHVMIWYGKTKIYLFIFEGLYFNNINASPITDLLTLYKDRETSMNTEQF